MHNIVFGITKWFFFYENIILFFFVFLIYSFFLSTDHVLILIIDFKFNDFS